MPSSKYADLSFFNRKIIKLCKHSGHKNRLIRGHIKVKGKREKVKGKREKVKGKRYKVEGKRYKVEGRRKKVEV